MEINNWIAAHIDDFNPDKLQVHGLEDSETMVINIGSEISMFFENNDQLNQFADRLFCLVKESNLDVMKDHLAELARIGDEEDGNY